MPRQKRKQKKSRRFQVLFEGESGRSITVRPESRIPASSDVPESSFFIRAPSAEAVKQKIQETTPGKSKVVVQRGGFEGTVFARGPNISGRSKEVAQALQKSFGEEKGVDVAGKKRAAAKRFRREEQAEAGQERRAERRAVQRLAAMKARTGSRLSESTAQRINEVLSDPSVSQEEKQRITQNLSEAEKRRGIQTGQNREERFAAAQETAEKRLTTRKLERAEKRGEVTKQDVARAKDRETLARTREQDLRNQTRASILPKRKDQRTTVGEDLRRAGVKSFAGVPIGASSKQFQVDGQTLTGREIRERNAQIARARNRQRSQVKRRDQERELGFQPLLSEEFFPVTTKRGTGRGAKTITFTLGEQGQINKKVELTGEQEFRRQLRQRRRTAQSPVTRFGEDLKQSAIETAKQVKQEDSDNLVTDVGKRAFAVGEFALGQAVSFVGLSIPQPGERIRPGASQTEFIEQKAKEEGTTPTPFERNVALDVDKFIQQSEEQNKFLTKDPSQSVRFEQALSRGFITQQAIATGGRIAARKGAKVSVRSEPGVQIETIETPTGTNLAAKGKFRVTRQLPGGQAKTFKVRGTATAKTPKGQPQGKLQGAEVIRVRNQKGEVIAEGKGNILELAKGEEAVATLRDVTITRKGQEASVREFQDQLSTTRQKGQEKGRGLREFDTVQSELGGGRATPLQKRLFEARVKGSGASREVFRQTQFQNKNRLTQRFEETRARFDAKQPEGASKFQRETLRELGFEEPKSTTQRLLESKKGQARGQKQVGETLPETASDLTAFEKNLADTLTSDVGRTVQFFDTPTGRTPTPAFREDEITGLVQDTDTATIQTFNPTFVGTRGEGASDRELLKIEEPRGQQGVSPKQPETEVKEVQLTPDARRNLDRIQIGIIEPGQRPDRGLKGIAEQSKKDILASSQIATQRGTAISQRDRQTPRGITDQIIGQRQVQEQEQRGFLGQQTAFDNFAQDFTGFTPFRPGTTGGGTPPPGLPPLLSLPSGRGTGGGDRGDFSFTGFTPDLFSLSFKKGSEKTRSELKAESKKRKGVGIRMLPRGLAGEFSEFEQGLDFVNEDAFNEFNPEKEINGRRAKKKKKRGQGKGESNNPFDSVIEPFL